MFNNNCSVSSLRGVVGDLEWTLRDMLEPNPPPSFNFQTTFPLLISHSFELTPYPTLSPSSYLFKPSLDLFFHQNHPLAPNLNFVRIGAFENGRNGLSDVVDEKTLPILGKRPWRTKRCHLGVVWCGVVWCGVVWCGCHLGGVVVIVVVWLSS